MEHYTVMLEDSDGYWFYFPCQADDLEHAKEQAVNAYPNDKVIWVNEGENYSMDEVPAELKG